MSCYLKFAKILLQITVPFSLLSFMEQPSITISVFPRASDSGINWHMSSSYLLMKSKWGKRSFNIADSLARIPIY